MRKLPGRGFTLIELLVTIAVILLLTAISLVGYSRFNERQVVAKATERLAVNLRWAQQKALSGQKPAGCAADLDGWLVRLSATDYSLVAVCGAAEEVLFSIPLPEGVTTTVQEVEFTVLTGEVVSGAGTITLNGLFGGRSYSNSVEVTEAGGVSVI